MVITLKTEMPHTYSRCFERKGSNSIIRKGARDAFLSPRVGLKVGKIIPQVFSGSITI
jgi:hypothetical protein